MNTEIVFSDRHDIAKLVPAKEYIGTLHHKSHAAGTFYQSPFEEALVFSFDGGGNDGMFNVYHATRKDGPVMLERIRNPIYNIEHINYDLGFPYMLFGQYLDDIRVEPLSEGNLVYPGKLMGLASYGKVVGEWLPHFMMFYKLGVNGYSYHGAVEYLGKLIGVKFDIDNRLTGEVAYNIAATSQRAFEESFLEKALPYLEKYPNIPVGITGGCGLNIILNTRLVNQFNRIVFVGPNPNDCGIAVGSLLDYLKPSEVVDLTYSGPPLLDLHTLPEYTQIESTRELVDGNSLQWVQSSKQIFIEDLVNGKIIGIARGRSEHGPRALGNRSILCNPSIPDMKDILNEKVKNREWYRPFAPVVRLEDVDKYFEWNGSSRWMSFCPTVREEWREKLAAITHVDNTARIQTVTRKENSWLYDVLTEFEKKTGVGVLLNTSFNVNGKPILNTIRDAYYIYNNTKMDCLLVENVYFRKEGFNTT